MCCTGTILRYFTKRSKTKISFFRLLAPPKMDPNYMEVFRILTIKMKNSGDPLEPLPLVSWLPY